MMNLNISLHKHQSMTLVRNSLLLVLTGMLLAGCVKSNDDLSRFIQETKARQPVAIEPLPKDKTPERFVYIVDNLRDPFLNTSSVGPDIPVAANGDEVSDGPRPIPNRPPEILEAFELDSLDMVGTFLVEGVNYGLIEDPDGVILRVRVGNYIGRNHGRITAVSDSRVELVELMPDGPNKWEEVQSQIALDDG